MMQVMTMITMMTMIKIMMKQRWEEKEEVDVARLAAVAARAPLSCCRQSCREVGGGPGGGAKAGGAPQRATEPQTGASKAACATRGSLSESRVKLGKRV